MDATHKFWSLCADAYEIDLKSVNCNDFAPQMIEIISLVRSNPNLNSEWIECFKRLIDGEQGLKAPVDIVPFCMRSLRFPEIRDYVMNLNETYPQGTAIWARKCNLWSHVFHAFDDPIWEDADMWEYYKHELGKTKG